MNNFIFIYKYKLYYIIVILIIYISYIYIILYLNNFIFQPGVKVDDFWEPGKSLLQDPGKFLDSLLKYDKDNIPDEIIKKITPYIQDENFTPSAIAKVCNTLLFLYTIVIQC